MKLELKNINVSLSNKPILKNISFSLEKGEFLSVLGPSGCGKSTLLKTIAGIIPCDKGTIYINGKNTAHSPAHKRGAVIVFQDIRLFPHMSVFENIAYPMKIKGLSKKIYTDKVTELLEKVKLKGYEHVQPHKLSGGEQQRVALARALAAEPEILLLDEPFSGLDENLRFDMRLLVLNLHKAYHMTTVMVTHDKEEALSMSDYIMVMDKGNNLQFGKPENIYENPESIAVARYFGNAAFIKGKVISGEFQSEELSFDCGYEDGSYILMVRYDDLYLEKGNDFKFTQIIYTGREKEFLLEHIRTGLIIKVRSNNSNHIKNNPYFSLNIQKYKLFQYKGLE
ncbi:MAG: ABC transporter ATP-binding protein [Lachnospiraceae bacterium]|nr:ABC transporter ATP-binding protein [Lachnospiraceae bacterium]